MKEKVEAIIAFYGLRKTLCSQLQQGIISLEQFRRADAQNAKSMGLSMETLRSMMERSFPIRAIWWIADIHTH